MSAAHRKSRRRGSAMIEFTFVGIPLMFVMISIFELSRGMWIYNTLATALKEGERYASSRGYGFQQNCESVLGSGNAACVLTVQKIARVIQAAGPGLVPSDVTNVQITLDPTGAAVSVPCGGNGTLADCLTNTTAVGATGTLVIGYTFSITAQYRFTNAISMFWPGTHPGQIHGTYNLPASSQDNFQY